MSFAGNPYVNLAPGPVPQGGTDPAAYQLQLLQLQRQQRMADILRQQASDPIPVQSSNGTPAPISWGSVLAKALQGVGAGMKDRAAQDKIQQMGVEDQASAQALVDALTHKTNQVGAPAIGGGTAQVDATAPQISGAPAPVQSSSQLSMPGQAAEGMQQVGPSSQDQLAAVLAARGGPQTQMIQQALIPQILNRQNMDYQHELGREDKLWANGLPMSEADKQEIAARSQAEQQNALFANKLPMTAAQRAEIGLKEQELSETKRYHNLVSGQFALGPDGLPQTDDPITQAWVKAVTSGNATMNQVPAPVRNKVALALNQTPTQSYNPLASRRLTMASNAITTPFMKLPQYELTANGLPYLQRIEAASKVPGSVSDQDLLDSLTKLNTSGNAVTDAQVRLITEGKSYADWANTLANKFKNGGVLSDNQRQQIREIASNIYENYRKGYQPVYDQATSQLKKAGIPEQFWTIPNLNKLNAAQAHVGPAANSAASGIKVPPPPPGFVVHQ
jgi:hypothetical protein